MKNIVGFSLFIFFAIIFAIYSSGFLHYLHQNKKVVSIGNTILEDPILPILKPKTTPTIIQSIPQLQPSQPSQPGQSINTQPITQQSNPSQPSQPSQPVQNSQPVIQVQCSNECTSNETNKCNLKGQVEKCGNFDNDNCLEWGGAAECPLNNVCQNGICIYQELNNIQCIENCTLGSKRCNNLGEIEICGYNYGKSCLVWGAARSCQNNSVCNNGACIPQENIIPQCQDECQILTTRCTSSSTYEVCSNYDPDICLEWSGSINCPSETPICLNNKCTIQISS